MNDLERILRKGDPARDHADDPRTRSGRRAEMLARCVDTRPKRRRPLVGWAALGAATLAGVAALLLRPATPTAPPPARIARYTPPTPAPPHRTPRAKPAPIPTVAHHARRTRPRRSSVRARRPVPPARVIVVRDDSNRALHLTPPRVAIAIVGAGDRLGVITQTETVP